MELFERVKGGEQSLLVQAHFSHAHQDPSDTDISELKSLVHAAGWSVDSIIETKRSQPDRRYFIGKGKLEEIKKIIQENEIELVIFNHIISASQERNLEEELKCRVLDRTRVVLEIFAQRAKTYEGRLQVELAQLTYASTRLVRAWTHLERQKGGIGVRGGPGEKQIELDRRMIKDRIRILEKKIEKVRASRSLSRQVRQKSHTPTISLVGYTNAGKSTLFNTLTNADVLVKDQLFATLDTMLRKFNLPYFGEVVFSDTVGFIRHLPHDLVDAFRATLEETAQADLLLHIIDASDPEYRNYMAQVYKVLKEIGADHIPVIEVYNKIDALGENHENEKIIPRVDYDQSVLLPKRVWCSAVTQEGLGLLKDAISVHLNKDEVIGTLILQPKNAKVRAQLYQIDAILTEKITEKGEYELKVRCGFYKLQSICDDNQLELGEIFHQD